MPSKSTRPALKQSKLSFGQSKSTAAANKPTKESPTIEATGDSLASSSTPRRSSRQAASPRKKYIEVDSSDEEERNLDDIDESQLEPDIDEAQESDIKPFTSEEEFKEKEQASAQATQEAQTKTKAKKAKSAISEPKVLGVPVEDKAKEKKAVETDIESRPLLNLKNKAYNEISQDAQEKMGRMQPIHGKNLNRVDNILRVFDMNYNYGPCVGMTRLERWQRAQAMGLNPPPEIHDILMTQEGLTETKYSQNVLFGRV